MSVGLVFNSTPRFLLTRLASSFAQKAVSCFHRATQPLFNGYFQANQSVQGRVLKIAESHLIKNHGATLLIGTIALAAIAARYFLNAKNPNIESEGEVLQNQRGSTILQETLSLELDILKAQNRVCMAENASLRLQISELKFQIDTQY